jgi:periplasmic copper chaperone A
MLMDRGCFAPLVGLVLALCLALAGGAALAGGDEDASPSPSAASAGSMPNQSASPSFDPAALGPGIHVLNPWSRESSLVALAGAAFMVIVNGDDTDDALVGASSPAATVEIHQTTKAEDGTMSMSPVDQILIPAGGSATLAPGGYHLMLLDLSGPLVAGETIDLTLEFAASAPQTVSVPIQALAPMSSSGGDSASPAATDVSASPEASDDNGGDRGSGDDSPEGEDD